MEVSFESRESVMLLRTICAAALVIALVPSALAEGDAAGCTPDTAGAGAAAAARDASAETLFTRPEAGVPANKRTSRGLYATATDAYEMVREDAAHILFIDVRTRGELQFIGMPTLVDAHVPFLVETDPPQWDEAASTFKLAPNPDFVAAVDRRLAQKGLTKDATVIVICQGGIRAARAVDALTRAGYTRAYTTIDGFEGDPIAEGPRKGERIVNGWRNAGLPWTARLDRARMYGVN
jgi:rhodanese-related sulfurtransferase